MQLLDYLKTADKDEYIYLGSGSGFLWIAKPEELIEKLAELDAGYIDGVQAKIQKSILEVKSLAADSMLKKWKKKKIAALKKQVKSYIPFGNREIKDMYKRKILAPLGTIVIIDGVEKGKYWAIDDMEEDNGTV